ncbi:MAG TPA: hypothetical protein VIF82_13895 [Burkholderiaceae bacterium]|jgi:hypothetical protein
MGYQFLREECYARIRSQGAPQAGKGREKKSKTLGKRSAREVIAELVREADATPHIVRPLAPVLLHGVPAHELMAIYEQIEAMSFDIEIPTKDGHRKQRSDTPIILGVVASFPGPADPSNQLYVSWKNMTVDFLKRRYGESLLSIFEHLDEKYGHMHAIIHNKGNSVKPLHAGHAAALTLKQKNKNCSRKAQADAYKAAERIFQDDYHKEVGISAGLGRIGPRRRRLSRAEWKAEQQAHEASAITFYTANKSVEAAKIKMVQADKRHQHIAVQAASIQALHDENQRELARQLADVAQLKSMNEKKAKELASALKDASVTRLKIENKRLRIYLKAFYRMLFAKKIQTSHRSHQKIHLRRG